MMSEPLFLSSIAAVAAIMMARSIGGAIRGRSASQSELTQLTERLDEHAATLENLEVNMDHQLSQIAELHERVDFAERLLAQSRDRTALGPGERLE